MGTLASPLGRIVTGEGFTSALELAASRSKTANQPASVAATSERARRSSLVSPVQKESAAIANGVFAVRSETQLSSTCTAGGAVGS